MNTDKKDNKLVTSSIISGLMGVLIVIGAGVIIGYVDFLQYKTKYIEQTKRNGMIAATRFQTVMSSFHLMAKSLDKWIEENPGKDPRNDKEFNSLVDVYRDYNKNKIDIRMVTQKGELYYFPVKDMKPKADVKDREYYKAHIDKKIQDLYFASPVLSRVTGKWGIPVSYRVKSNNQYVYILFAAIEYQILDTLYEGLIDELDGAIILTKKSGEVLYRKPSREGILGKSSGELLEDRKFEFADRSVEMSRLKGSKERRLIVHIGVDGFPVEIALSKNYDMFFKGWLKQVVLKIFTIIITLTIFMFLITRTIILAKKLQETKEQLQIIAYHDSLTGLKNRGYFFERISEEIERTKRNNSTFVLILIDIDNFKKVNDTYGHPTGNNVLEEFADILKTSIRDTDIAGRVGGEEFSVLLPETQLDYGVEVAERIRSRTEKMKVEEWIGGVSIGISEYRLEDNGIEKIYNRVDKALYRAKKTGKNKVVKG